jgi:hypothetical protein
MRLENISPIYIDGDLIIKMYWNIHKDFFENINNFMYPDSALILQENKRASSPEIFEQLMQNTPITLKKSYTVRKLVGTKLFII